MSNRTRKISPATDAAEALIPGDGSDAERMIAELKQALADKDAQLAVAQAAKPPRAPRAPRVAKVVTLDDIIAKQAKTPPKWAILGLAAFVEARTEKDQSESQAIADVAQQFAQVTTEFMAYRHETPDREAQTLMLCAWDFFNEKYGQAKPKTNPNPFKKKAEANGASAEVSTSVVTSDSEPSALEEVLN